MVSKVKIWSVIFVRFVRNVAKIQFLGVKKYDVLRVNVPFLCILLMFYDFFWESDVVATVGYLDDIDASGIAESYMSVLVDVFLVK